MANPYPYNSYLAHCRKKDKLEETNPLPHIPLRTREFIDRSVKFWREKTTYEILSLALGEALEGLSPRDRNLLLAYAECGNYAEIGRRIGRTRQLVKPYIDKLLQNMRLRVESLI
jgi:DNA-directed RNA polymerase specialized sigma24 family protein